MQSVALVTSPPTLPAIFKQIIEEGGMSPQSEKLMFDQLQRMEEKLNGNGKPGVFTRLYALEQEQERTAEARKVREVEIADEKKAAIDRRRNSFWYKLAFQSATVGVALVLGAIWNNYFNRAPSPTDKKLATTEEQIKTDSEQRDKRLDSMEDTLARIEKSLPVLARPRATARPPRTAARKPEPLLPAPGGPGASLRDGEMITTKGLPAIRMSSMRPPDFGGLGRP